MRGSGQYVACPANIKKIGGRKYFSMPAPEILNFSLSPFPISDFFNNYIFEKFTKRDYYSPRERERERQIDFFSEARAGVSLFPPSILRRTTSRLVPTDLSLRLNDRFRSRETKFRRDSCRCTRVGTGPLAKRLVILSRIKDRFSKNWAGKVVVRGIVQTWDLAGTFNPPAPR